MPSGRTLLHLAGIGIFPESRDPVFLLWVKSGPKYAARGLANSLAQSLSRHFKGLANDAGTLSRKPETKILYRELSFKPLEKDILLAFVYGSVTKSSDTKESAIDFLLVGDGLSYDDIIELLIPL